MHCPYCETDDDKVIDSRPSDEGRAIRRRRECNSCHKRFTTYERVEQTARLMVVKKDGTRVQFNPENILRGVQAACGKRPVPEHAKQSLVDAIEDELHRDFDREVPSIVIGERVMSRLRDLDEIAYIRYACEYHGLETADQVAAEASEFARRPKHIRDQQDLFERA
ncbi:MAG: transcriptional repressor NrdR [Phycisphaeraceae bacterium]|nr:transcriptional repressor NrdR [Phycisphaerales bacterium]MCB9860227.1 transcriptional repressor NrdR [Phycisphaeraceae bacterium]